MSEMTLEKAFRGMARDGRARQRADETRLARHVAELIGEMRPELDRDERAVAAELVLGTDDFYKDNDPSTTLHDRIVMGFMELGDDGITL